MMSLSSCCRPSHGDSSGTAATTELMGRCVPVWWPGDCDSNPLLSSVEGPQIEFMVGQVLIKRVLPKTEICSFHVTQNSFFFFLVLRGSHLPRLASDSLGSRKITLNSRILPLPP